MLAPSATKPRNIPVNTIDCGNEAAIELAQASVSPIDRDERYGRASVFVHGRGVPTYGATRAATHSYTQSPRHQLRRTRPKKSN